MRNYGHFWSYTCLRKSSPVPRRSRRTIWMERGMGWGAPSSSSALFLLVRQQAKGFLNKTLPLYLRWSLWELTLPTLSSLLLFRSSLATELSIYFLLVCGRVPWEAVRTSGEEGEGIDCYVRFSLLGSSIDSVDLQSGASGERLGWVDLNFGSSLGWWAASVATYCPSRVVEHP